LTRPRSFRYHAPVMGRRAVRQLASVAVVAALVAALAVPALGAPKLTTPYLASITQDEEGGPLYFPFSAFVDRARNEVYVIDGRGRVIIYSSSFFPLVTIGKGSGIVAPTAAAVDTSGNVYIAQAPGKGSPVGRINVLDACLKPLRQINFSGFEGAGAFAPQRLVRRSDGSLLVVGSGAAGIVVIEPDGRQRLINPAAKEVEGDPHFSALSLDAAGNLYAVSEELGRVYVLDAELRTVRRFGQKGGSSGKLSRPQGVAADAARGLFYVVDYMRHAVSVYDADGKYITEFGGLGLGPGWFQYPKDVALDSTGRLFVVDTFNQRLQVFELKWEAGEATPTGGPEAAAPPAASSLPGTIPPEESAPAPAAEPAGAAPTPAPSPEAAPKPAEPSGQPPALAPAPAAQPAAIPALPAPPQSPEAAPPPAAPPPASQPAETSPASGQPTAPAGAPSN